MNEGKKDGLVDIQESKYTKKNNLLITLICVIAAICILIVVIILLQNTDKMKIDKQLYLFANGQKIVLEPETVIERSKDNTLILKNNGKEYNLTSEPLFFDDNHIIVPNTMEFINTQTGQCNKIPYFAEITFDGKNIICTNRKKNRDLMPAFLFDGGDLYLFLQDVTIVFDDKEIKIPMFSYARVVYNHSIEIFNNDNGTVYYQKTDENPVVAELSDGSSIDLSKDILQSVNGKRQILISEPNELPELP